MTNFYCKFVNDFLFAKEIAIPQHEAMSLKLEKVHHREFEVQKNYSKIFLSPNISQSIIFFAFQVNSRIEVFLEKSCS